MGPGFRRPPPQYKGKADAQKMLTESSPAPRVIRVKAKGEDLGNIVKWCCRSDPAHKAPGKSRRLPAFFRPPPATRNADPACS
jgi:hypothetical protein